MHHSSVEQAVVLLREDSPGDRRLVGYVVTKSTLDEQSLPIFLQQKLPHYMVPAHFILLGEMPLMPNGKINRKALPIPDLSAPKTKGKQALPSTPTQEKVAEIWQKILAMSSIDVHDNFFAIGGHSLLAAQVIARLRAHYAIDINLRTLFESNTIAQLADAIDALQAQGASLTSNATAIPRSSRRR